MAPLFDPDHRTLIGRSDLVHTGRITTGTQGMCVANGRFGGPVWQSDGSTLVMQLNHTDMFMFNDASAASKDHPNTGGGAVGRLHVGFGAGVVFDGTTEQQLSLYDGKLSISGAGVEVDVIADMDADVIAIRLADNRATPRAITVDLAMLRDANQMWGAHSAISTLTTVAGDDRPLSLPEMIVLEQVVQEECDTGIAANDFYVNTAVAVAVRGRAASELTHHTVGGRASLRLILPAHNGACTIVIGGCTTMDPTRPARSDAVANVATSPGHADIYTRSAAWWRDFWHKSYVYFPSQANFEQRRNYYMYLAAISNRGCYPGKYNGGIWIGEEDRRDWGSFYWNWNQDCLYQPLWAANHLDLMAPFFTMRQASYEQYETAARQMWGGEGIFIGETNGILGWETLPDHIAEGLQRYYGFNTSSPTPEFTEFTQRRNRFLPAWNWNVFGGSNQASYVTHTMMATQETAEYCWRAYCYTRDAQWLRTVAYRFIRGAAELYRSYGGLRKEADGKYHFQRTNVHEHIWAGSDAIDDLAMARGVFTVVVEASELLGVDAAKRPAWTDIRDNLAAYPLRCDPGALWAASTDPSLAAQLSTDEPAWAQGLQPAHFIRDLHGTESPIFKMLEKYDVLNLETRDQGLDNGDWEIAINTYLHSPGYLNQVTNQVVDRNGSSRFPLDAAKLGRADDLARILNTQYGAFSTHGEFPNLLFDQLDYYSAEGYGTFADALQEALQQSLSPTPVGEPVIRVFPAWPETWDAKYKLLAKDGFLVSSSMESGDIQYVEIESQLGGTARIRNPWPGAAVLYRSGTRAETLAAGHHDLLEFPTGKGEHVVLVRQGTTPERYRSSDVTEARRAPRH